MGLLVSSSIGGKHESNGLLAEAFKVQGSTFNVRTRVLGWFDLLALMVDILALTQLNPPSAVTLASRQDSIYCYARKERGNDYG
jgi:hypothetical protein